MSSAEFDVVSGPNQQVPESMEVLVQRVIDAQSEAESAEAEAAAQTVTIADVAAAAFVALETIVAILGTDRGAHVIEEFEKRAALYAAGMED